MRKPVLNLCFLFLVLNLLIAQEPGIERPVRLASLEWPPYVGEKLPGQGAVAVAARAAFSEMGYALEIDFYPWARTLAMAQRSGMYDGYLPEYYSAEIEKKFIYSDPLGESPLGFVERRNDPVSWSDWEDLQGLLIGTVQGYVNSEEFDRQVEAGNLSVEITGTDVQNVRMVAAGRIPLAVIDRHVLSWLQNAEDTLTPFRHQLQFNPTILDVRKLYICFQRTEEGRRYAEIFNEGMKRIDSAGLMKK